MPLQNGSNQNLPLESRILTVAEITFSALFGVAKSLQRKRRSFNIVAFDGYRRLIPPTSTLIANFCI